MGSVTFWIDRLKAGDSLAVSKLWDGYYRNLVGLARSRLQAGSCRGADEEDVALSAFHSFCCGAEQGRFRQLEDRNDLWQLLVLLTARKAANLIQSECRQKRGGGKVVSLSELQPNEDDEEGDVVTGLIGREPDPGFVVQMTEQCHHLLDRLGDDTLRNVAVWKMENYTNEEIAVRIGRSLGTVERKLQLIRRIWEEELP